MNTPIHRFSFFAAILLLALACHATARATSFSVLLKPGGCTADQCDDDTGYLSIVNPLFNEPGGSGDNPLYEPSAMLFDPSQLSNGRDVIFTVNFGPSIGDPFDPAPGGGFPFEMKLEDVETGESITEFEEPFDIFFQAPRLQPVLGPETLSELALNFYDDTLASPRWVVEDGALSLNDLPAVGGGPYVQCSCTHLSIFSFGPAAIPEPTAACLAVLAILPGLFRQRV